MSKFFQRVNSLEQLRKSTDDLIRNELTRALPLGRLSPQQKQNANELLKLAEPRDLSHSQLARIRRNKLDVPRSLSFGQILVTEWESVRIGAALPGRELDNKSVG